MAMVTAMVMVMVMGNMRARVCFLPLHVSLYIGNEQEYVLNVIDLYMCF